MSYPNLGHSFVYSHSFSVADAMQILDELAENLKWGMNPNWNTSPNPGRPTTFETLTNLMGASLAIPPLKSQLPPLRDLPSCPSPPSGVSPTLDQPCCKAPYDFKLENDDELGFKEGDIITSQTGFFPFSYVEVLVPLPQRNGITTPSRLHSRRTKLPFHLCPDDTCRATVFPCHLRVRSPPGNKLEG